MIEWKQEENRFSSSFGKYSLKVMYSSIHKWWHWEVSLVSAAIERVAYAYGYGESEHAITGCEAWLTGQEYYTQLSEALGFKFDLEHIAQVQPKWKRQAEMETSNYASHHRNAHWLAPILNDEPDLMALYHACKNEARDKYNPPFEDEYFSAEYLKLFYFVRGHFDGKYSKLYFHYLMIILVQYELESRQGVTA